ncbi:hypothetical protein [Saccharothrix luteola]|uniref:hypothetical protein n=1 Tax=Saccharothrix luteola TaxID=2893018 RepID=UPI001E3F95F6|nr:hypothetical protein [Saccharothrix luteola]MCC8242841.1 hypothetical protein [Saccharothrix luteola]
MADLRGVGRAAPVHLAGDHHPRRRSRRSAGGGNYGNLVTQNGLRAADYGVAAPPLADKTEAGVLGGGTPVVVSPKIGERGEEAAVKWIDFYYTGKLTDQDAAVWWRIGRSS